MENFKRSDKKNALTYLRYTGMGFQLIGVILIGYYLGDFLDRKWNAGNPRYWTAGLILVFMFAYLYKLIKDLSRDKL
ncbi:MAG: AtpZ/AtpI family protein [Saprospiraceae bacterium]|nr:AtpZ/AtpI family protein [Saprospiraceae bacterium]